jgi:flagellar hook-associated protein 3 FlgL
MRELLELLLFKLEEEQLLLAAGRTRWVAHATREVEVVLDQIRHAEVIGAAHTQAVAGQLGLLGDASLAELADTAPAPWSELLHQHRAAFLALTAEITGLANANRDLLTLGARAVWETVLIVTGSLETYGSCGETMKAAARAPRPVGEAMRLRGDVSQLQRYSRNAEDGKAWLGTIDSALTSAFTQLNQARDLVVQGISTGSGSPRTAMALANQIDSIRQSMIDVANTTYLGRPVFGGTTSGPQAYDSTGAYLGDSGEVRRTVGDGVTVRVDASGPAVFGSGPAQLFGILTSISNNLRTNPSALSNDLTALDTAMETVQNALSDGDARYNQVQRNQQAAQNRLIAVKSQLSGIEDIDLPGTITDLQLQQTAYQAALAATSRVVQPSLVDFLK